MIISYLSKHYSKEDVELEIYGPECIDEHLSIDFTLILPGSRINLNNGFVEVFKNDCWKAEGCVAYLITIENKKILHTADSC